VSTTEAPPQPAVPARSGVPRGFSALIGLLAVGAALGVGHLVAALVSPASSPYLAVGDTVVRNSPQFLTEFAKTTFGTVDKTVLLAGMAVVIALVAAAAGLASRRSAQPGVGVVVVLGLLGLAAVVFAPTFAPLDLVAPLVSLGTGVGVFRWLHRHALEVYAPVVGPGSHAGAVSRRTVLRRGALVAGVGALAAGGLGLLLRSGAGSSRQAVTDGLAAARIERAPAIPPGAAFPGYGTPTFLTANADFYRIDVALRIPDQTAAGWKLRLHGMVDKEITLTFDDLLARPLVERAVTLTCVSNPVGGDLISTANFVGVELRDILLEAGVQPGADQIYSTSVDGWYTGTPVDVLMEPGRGALLAIGMNGEALPPEHGFPVRMVVPGLYGFVSATKWVVDLEATTFDNPQKTGYWLERGWSQKAPIKTEARIDFPRGLATVPSGKVTVAGIAWAQHTGIEKVEVRMDGGPWQPAELATEVNYDTWRMWRSDFTLAPGSHTVQARATDRTGAVQTEMPADPVPDGASGWPAVLFTAS
jgi:DMSO/TMAO reductase YedYZ molybdopterin-dependent catalytic subunit